MSDQRFKKGDRVFVTLPADPPIRFVPWRDTATVISVGVLTDTLKLESVKLRERGKPKVYRIAQDYCSLNPVDTPRNDYQSPGL